MRRAFWLSFLNPFSVVGLTFRSMWLTKNFTFGPLTHTEPGTTLVRRLPILEMNDAGLAKRILFSFASGWFCQKDVYRFTSLKVQTALWRHKVKKYLNNKYSENILLMVFNLNRMWWRCWNLFYGPISDCGHCCYCCL